MNVEPQVLIRKPTPTERPVFVAGAIAQARRIAYKAAHS